MNLEGCEPQIINYLIIITFLDKRTKVDIKVTGTDNVLVSLEMNFRKGGKLLVLSKIKIDLIPIS